MKRKFRKKLKEDELVTTVNKIFHFIQERTKKLMALVLGILFIVVIFAGMKFIKAKNKKSENRLLTQIINLHSDLNNKPENLARLEELAGDGKFSRLAYVLLATYWMENGDSDKARSFVEKIPETPKDFFYYQAKDLLAQIHFKRKEYDKSLEIYKKMEEESPKDYSMDVILFHRAEINEEKGDVEQALALYRRVQDEFPQTFYGYEASQKVGKLETQK
ncbi:MAG: tetratricopeptide repeat protein [Candidatus Aminicenantes bacterium]|nr:tetratricopeptide repeat protein [Candidatus Aminicenantes bacterium]